MFHLFFTKSIIREGIFDIVYNACHFSHLTDSLFAFYLQNGKKARLTKIRSYE